MLLSESYFKYSLIVKSLICCKEFFFSFSRIKLISFSANPYFSLARFETTLKKLWDNDISTLKQRWNGVVQHWKTVASTLCKVDLMLFQCWALTLYQCCATLKIRLPILLLFQSRWWWLCAWTSLCCLLFCVASQKFFHFYLIRFENLKISLTVAHLLFT